VKILPSGTKLNNTTQELPPQTPSGGGTGTVTSITATTPIVVTPSPITNTGVVSHATSGVAAATYGDASHYATFTVNASGHITSASQVAVSAGTGTFDWGKYIAGRAGWPWG